MRALIHSLLMTGTACAATLMTPATALAGDADFTLELTQFHGRLVV